MNHAYIDESTPRQDSGTVLYGLAAVVVHENSNLVETTLRTMFNRKNPFHWEGEGSDRRKEIVAYMAKLDMSGIVVVMPSANKAQLQTRSYLLTHRLAPKLFDDDDVQLHIERRSRSENRNDIEDLRDWCRESRVKMPTGIEHVSKEVPGIWLADALAGIGTDAVLGRDRSYLSTLLAAGSLRSLELITDMRRPHAGT